MRCLQSYAHVAESAQGFTICFTMFFLKIANTLPRQAGNLQIVTANKFNKLYMSFSLCLNEILYIATVGKSLNKINENNQPTNRVRIFCTPRIYNLSSIINVYANVRNKVAFGGFVGFQ